jgi:hypothetical protein
VFRRWLSRLAWFFGIRWGDPDDALAASHEIVAVRADLLSSAAWLAALAAAMSGLMVVAFDWSASEMIPGGLIGAAVWGAMNYFTAVRHQVPQEARLPAAPSGATIDRDRWRPLRIVLWAPVFVGLAWLVDRWDLGAVFIPGQYLGHALADFAGAVLVGRWQNLHGGTVVMRWNHDEPDLYTA